MVNTREKILQATIQLIRDKGFNAATTRAIADNAGVNEITIFRHFGNKKGVLEALIKRFSYVPTLPTVVKENVIWDLEKDLYMIAKTYQRIMSTNGDLIIIMISLKEAGGFPELEQEIVEIPRHLKETLNDYFLVMQEKGKIIETNIEALVMSFIYINFGLFFTNARFGKQILDLEEDDFLKNSMHIFSRGLKP